MDEALQLGGYFQTNSGTYIGDPWKHSNRGAATQTRLPLRYRISALAWAFLGSLAGFGFWIELIGMFRTRPVGFGSPAIAIVQLLVGILGVAVSAYYFLGH